MEVKCVKKTCTLAQLWWQRCSCCHNCSEHNNRNCPVSGKITPSEVAASSWGLVCVPGACLCCRQQRRQWAWFRRQQASSNFRLTASLLKWPFASAVNATSERSVSQSEHRKRYVTFTLRNARLFLSKNRAWPSLCLGLAINNNNNNNHNNNNQIYIAPYSRNFRGADSRNSATCFIFSFRQ